MELSRKNLENALWCEKYRPQTIKDCILPDSIKSIFQEYVNKKYIPHLLLAGPPGGGKTTVAKALCQEVGCDFLFLNGSKESGIDVLRNKISQYASSVSLTGGRKVVIIDEAEFLNPNSFQPALRAFLEEFSNNVSFILTCNWKNRIIDPIQSRCATIEFNISGSDKKLMANQFMGRLDFMLKSEGVKYDPKVIAALIVKYFPNYRKIINELQKFSQLGDINESILTTISDIDIQELVIALKDKNFSGVKKWVSKSSDMDVNLLFRRIYDSLSVMLKPHSIPAIVLILAKYQFQASAVMDQEINLLACLVEIMVDGEFV